MLPITFYGCLVNMLLVPISTAYSLVCYVCNSKLAGDSCSSTEKILESNTFLVDCRTLGEGDKHTYCRKIEQEIPLRGGKYGEFNFWLHALSTSFTFRTGGSEIRTIRQCGYYNRTYTGCYRGGLINGGHQVICTCDEDGCNSGTHFQPQHSMLSISFGVVLLTSLFSTF